MTTEQHVMQSLLTQINVLIQQAEIMPKTGSLAQARLVCGLHEMRDIAAKAMQREVL